MCQSICDASFHQNVDPHSVCHGKIFVHSQVLICLCYLLTKKFLQQYTTVEAQGDLPEFNRNLIDLHYKMLDYLTQQRANSGRILYEYNVKILSKLIDVLSSFKCSRSKAFKYVNMKMGNLMPNQTCWSIQTKALHQFTVTAIEDEKRCIDNSMKSIQSLTRSYFYTMTNEMVRQSFSSPHLALYAIGQYNPLTEASKVILTLRSTILFSRDNWNGTVDIVDNELWRIDNGASENIKVLEKCDRSVTENYLSLLGKHVHNTLQC